MYDKLRTYYNSTPEYVLKDIFYKIDPDRIAMPPPQSPISPIPQSPMGTMWVVYSLIDSSIY